MFVGGLTYRSSQCQRLVVECDHGRGVVVAVGAGVPAEFHHEQVGCRADGKAGGAAPGVAAIGRKYARPCIRDGHGPAAAAAAEFQDAASDDCRPGVGVAGTAERDRAWAGLGESPRRLSRREARAGVVADRQSSAVEVDIAAARKAAHAGRGDAQIQRAAAAIVTELACKAPALPRLRVPPLTVVGPLKCWNC